MEKYYRFAGVDLAISIEDTRMYDDARHLAVFEVQSVCDPHRYEFFVTDTLTPPTGKCVTKQPAFFEHQDGAKRIRYIGTSAEPHTRAEHDGKAHRIELKASVHAGKVGSQTVLTALQAENLILEAGGVILHASYIDIGGRAVLFTAPSETGKSTQAELWREHRGADIINGDRTAIIKIDGKAHAAGIPFAGSSVYCKNKTLPLGAIVYLGQAPSTNIRRLSGAEAFLRVWEGISVNSWNKGDVARATDIVLQIASSVPIYHLECTPDESAVIALEGEGV